MVGCVYTGNKNSYAEMLLNEMVIIVMVVCKCKILWIWPGIKNLWPMEILLVKFCRINIKLMWDWLGWLALQSTAWSQIRLWRLLERLENFGTLDQNLNCYSDKNNFNLKLEIILTKTIECALKHIVTCIKTTFLIIFFLVLFFLVFLRFW